MDSEIRDILLALFACVLGAFVAFAMTTKAYRDWRPLVSEWAEISVPHQAAPIEVPRRIEWRGVEYDCMLVEKEEE